MRGSDREKLIELLEENWIDFFKYEPVNEHFPAKFMTLHIDQFVDFLLSNGVTFAENATVESKWIPVTERLPDIESTHKIQRGDKYTKSIRVLCACEQKGGKRMVKEGYCEIWNGNISDPCWKIPGTVDFVTHWMPLPEPPKEG